LHYQQWLGKILKKLVLPIRPGLFFYPPGLLSPFRGMLKENKKVSGPK